MPILTVINGSKTHFKFPGYCDVLKEEIVCIKELDLIKDDITIILVAPENADDVNEVIVFVDGLFEKPERTDEVRAELAKVIGEFIKPGLKTGLLEVFIRAFNPASGFWTSAGH